MLTCLYNLNINVINITPPENGLLFSLWQSPVQSSGVHWTISYPLHSSFDSRRVQSGTVQWTPRDATLWTPLQILTIEVVF